MNKQQKYTLVLFFSAFFAVSFFLLVNRAQIFNDAPELLRLETTIVTADDASYLVPPENFLAGKGWKTNQAGKVAYTLRSPGYGLIYAGFRSVLQEKRALQALVLFQVFLFALAVSLLPKVVGLLQMSFLKKDELNPIPERSKFWFFISLGIGVMPMFLGFLPYTLTEGVTPALVIIFLFLLLSCYHSSGVMETGMLLGFLILIRPAMIFWVAGLVVLAVVGAKSQRKKMLWIAALALSPILIWQTYISIKTQEIQGLHAIYQDDANDLYRPLHRDIWNFHKSWGQTGYGFNASVNALWGDALNHRDATHTLNKIMESIPERVKNTVDQEELAVAYAEYFEILKQQVPYAESKRPVEGITPAEEKLSSEFKAFKKSFVRHYPWESYVVVPAGVYWEMGAHSNLSLYVFQKTWRGNPIVEALRYFSFMIHLGTFLLFPLSLFYFQRNRVLWSVAVAIGLYLGYLCIFQRGIEERYTLPVLIPMVLVVCFVIMDFVDGIKLRISKQFL